MNTLEIKEYIEYRIRKLKEYVNVCLYHLENATLSDIDYYDKELNKTKEVIDELKALLEVINNE